MNVMGININRRKSNLTPLNRNDDNRASINSNNSINNHQNKSMDTLNSIDDSPTTSTIIVTDMRQTYNHNSSRPSSGHHYFLTTSTPNRSRSPSMASNRDSLISNEALLDCTPPILPPKREYSNGDNQSLTNFEISSNHSGSREDLVTNRILIKKKPPPPPPPTINESEITPTPPRRPALKPPTD